MSKAFTREDDAADEPILTRQPTQLPPGVKNYITPNGARRLREELDYLTQAERPRLVKDLSNETENADATELRRKLQMLNQRVQVIDHTLQSAEIVEPPTGSEEMVRFGASVTVRDSTGDETQYRIVGVNETDLDRNWVSWRSPIARALLNARIGQTVRFRFPAGEQDLKIIKVTYE